jgi:hypothetical protein
MLALLCNLPAYVVTRRMGHLIYVECRAVAMGLTHSSSEEGETKFQQFILIQFWNDIMGWNESVAYILQVSRSSGLFFSFHIIRREWATRVLILQVGAGCLRLRTEARTYSLLTGPWWKCQAGDWRGGWNFGRRSRFDRLLPKLTRPRQQTI